MEKNLSKILEMMSKIDPSYQNGEEEDSNSEIVPDDEIDNVTDTEAVPDDEIVPNTVSNSIQNNSTKLEVKPTNDTIDINTLPVRQTWGLKDFDTEKYNNIRNGVITDKTANYNSLKDNKDNLKISLGLLLNKLGVLTDDEREIFLHPELPQNEYNDSKFPRIKKYIDFMLSDSETSVRDDIISIVIGGTKLYIAGNTTDKTTLTDILYGICVLYKRTIVPEEKREKSNYFFGSSSLNEAKKMASDTEPQAPNITQAVGGAICYQFRLPIHHKIRAYLYYRFMSTKGRYLEIIRQNMFGPSGFDDEKSPEWDDIFTYMHEWHMSDVMPDKYDMKTNTLPTFGGVTSRFKKAQASKDWTAKIKEVFKNEINILTDADTSLFNTIVEHIKDSIDVFNYNYNLTVLTAYDRLEQLLYNTLKNDVIEDEEDEIDEESIKESFANLSNSITLKKRFPSIPWDALIKNVPVTDFLNQENLPQVLKELRDEMIMSDSTGELKINEETGKLYSSPTGIRNFLISYMGGKIDEGDSHTETEINKNISNMVSNNDFLYPSNTRVIWETNINEDKKGNVNKKLKKLIGKKSLDGGIPDLEIGMEYQGLQHFLPGTYKATPFYRELHMGVKNNPNIDRFSVWGKRHEEWMDIWSQNQNLPKNEILALIEKSLDKEFPSMKVNAGLAELYRVAQDKSYRGINDEKERGYFLQDIQSYSDDIRTPKMNIVTKNTLVLSDIAAKYAKQNYGVQYNTDGNTMVDKYGIPINLDLRFYEIPIKDKNKYLTEFYKSIRNANPSTPPHNCKRRWMLEANVFITQQVNDLIKTRELSQWDMYYVLPKEFSDEKYGRIAFDMMGKLSNIYSKLNGQESGLFKDVVNESLLENGISKYYIWPINKDLLLERIKSAITTKLNREKI